MYIEPNTVIRLLTNCPLDNTYDHTIYFNGAEAQFEYFAGLTKYTLSKQTYQRVNRSRMRVQYKADDLYDCNYLMFQNTNFGNKWFYAFVKSVEYINNIVSEIEYEIDVMQTWAFDYRLGECFVDREHSATDNVGDNLIPERLEHGSYISDSLESDGFLYRSSIIVACTFDEQYKDVYGSYIAGIFSGLAFIKFPNTAAGALEAAKFIGNAGAKSDGIVSVFLIPSVLTEATSGTPVRKTVTKQKSLTLKRADGTEVKNKKLYTYPYNFLYVTNLQGTSAEYRYEFFNSENCEFVLTGDVSVNPSVLLWPTNYKGVQSNLDEKICLSGFPQLAYNTDTFKAWIAQNATSLGVNALSSAIGLGNQYAANQISQQYAKVGGDAARASLGAAMLPLSAAASAASLVAQVYEHTLVPMQAKGAGGSTTLSACELMQFAFMTKHIQPQFASIIDDYFTMYGYATHRVKVPNRNVRPYWTYTKTVGCVVHGSVPCDDMSKICKIFDNGITFWTNGNNIGNYSLDNSV